METPYPTFRVTEITRDDSRVALEGTVSVTRVGRETWVGDRHIGCLKRGAFLAAGRWHGAGNRWRFVLDRPEHLSELEGAAALEVLDGYWGKRAELVLDQSLFGTRSYGRTQPTTITAQSVGRRSRRRRMANTLQRAVAVGFVLRVTATTSPSERWHSSQSLPNKLRAR
jgi:hypothetical protein